ncbi:MAG: hypothetical protein P4L51_23475 [Puia sp.]|nr:hypothetical protein [Puia sp.]
MKLVLFVSGAFILLVLACRWKQNSRPVIEFHPAFFYTGTYVYAEETTFQRIWDTLVLTMPDHYDHINIVRHTYFQRKIENKSFPVTFTREKLTGILDGFGNRVTIPGRSIYLDFKPETFDGLYLLSNAYKKIEN